MLLNSELMKVNLLRENHFWSLWFITSPAGAVAKYCNEYVCPSVGLSVCLSARISPEPHARSLPNFLRMLPMSVARSSSDTFMIGCIASHQEGVFFPIENALSARKGDGSAQRGQSMLSTIALLRDQIYLMLVNYECCIDEKKCNFTFHVD